MAEDVDQLLLKAQAHDVDAFGALIVCYERMIFAYAYTLLGDHHNAEDATQDTFFEAYRELPHLKHPRALASWLRKIVVKQCDRQTRRKSIPRLPVEAALDLTAPVNPAKSLQQREQLDAIRVAVAALPNHERTVVNLFYLEEQSQQKISVFLEVPVSQINNWLHSARKLLRERLSDMSDELVQASMPVPDDIGERVKFLLGMAERLDAGESCYQALLAQEKLAAPPVLKQAIADMAASLVKGVRLSEAFRQHPKLFPATVVWLIETGERLSVLDIATRMAFEWLKTGGLAEEGG